MTTFGWFSTIITRLGNDSSHFQNCCIFAIFLFSIINIRYGRIFPNLGNGEFDNFWVTLYSTSLIYFGASDYSSYQPVKNFTFSLIYFLMTLTSVKSLNFLIAIFANTVSFVMNNYYVVCTSQQLGLIYYIEARFRRLPFTKYLYSKFTNKVFEVYDSKVCLKTTTTE